MKKGLLFLISLHLLSSCHGIQNDCEPTKSLTTLLTSFSIEQKSDALIEQFLTIANNTLKELENKWISLETEFSLNITNTTISQEEREIKQTKLTLQQEAIETDIEELEHFIKSLEEEKLLLAAATQPEVEQPEIEQPEVEQPKTQTPSQSKTNESRATQKKTAPTYPFKKQPKRKINHSRNIERPKEVHSRLEASPQQDIPIKKQAEINNKPKLKPHDPRNKTLETKQKTNVTVPRYKNNMASYKKKLEKLELLNQRQKR